MIVTKTGFRVGGVIAAGAVALVLATACSSVSNGIPVGAVSASTSATRTSAPASTSAGSGSSTAGSGSTGPSAAASVSAFPSSSDPALSGSKFCKDFAGQGGLTGVNSQNDVSKVIRVWDRLAAEAPAAIKSDVQDVADFLHAELTGKIDPTAAQKLSLAAQHIGIYIASNCH